MRRAGAPIGGPEGREWRSGAASVGRDSASRPLISIPDCSASWQRPRQTPASVSGRRQIQRCRKHGVHRVVLVDGIAGGPTGVKGRPTGRCATLDTGHSTSAWGHMNDPEVIMSNALPKNTLIAHSKALEAAGIAIALVVRVPAPLKSIADQAIRSASSVPANLTEGHGRFGRDRLHHWRIAYASAKEVDTHLRLLAQAGAIDKDRTNTALGLFDQVRAMTWRLLHPR